MPSDTDKAEDGLVSGTRYEWIQGARMTFEWLI